MKKASLASRNIEKINTRCYELCSSLSWTVLLSNNLNISFNGYKFIHDIVDEL